MTSPSKPPLPENALAFDGSPEAAVAWAQRRHAMLDRLAVIGMRLAEEVVQRSVDSPYHPEIKHEPARAYAQVARAVRFTLALQGRVEAQIIAMRNGDPFSKVFASDLDNQTSAPSKTSPDRFRQRARDAVADAIDREIPDREAAERALGRLHENLIERETYDALLTLPFRDCVEAICADFGLDPDWRRWSDEAGFAEQGDMLPPDGRRDRPDDPGNGDDRCKSTADPPEVGDRKLEPVGRLE
jgi:hypothetical protein